MSFTEHNVNGLIYDTSDVITAAGSGAVHAFTTRHGGVSPAPYDSLNFADNKGDTSENLLENYRLLGEAVGFDASRAVGCRQIHSDHVCVAREEDAGKLVHDLVRIASEKDAGKILWDDRPYDADGLITNVPNLPLFAYGTDCCVITLYDPTSRSIGAVHAGWRGTASGIALKAAVSMMSCYGADPYTLRAAIGPSIGKCCFETDSDVAVAFFALLDPAMDERIEQRGDNVSESEPCLKAHVQLSQDGVHWADDNTPEAVIRGKGLHIVKVAPDFGNYIRLRAEVSGGSMRLNLHIACKG